MATANDATTLASSSHAQGGISVRGQGVPVALVRRDGGDEDLGLNNKTQNKFAFWGLSKPPRRPSDPLVALDRALERYHGNVEALVRDGVTDENRSKVVAAIATGPIQAAARNTPRRPSVRMPMMKVGQCG